MPSPEDPASAPPPPSPPEEDSTFFPQDASDWQPPEPEPEPEPKERGFERQLSSGASAPETVAGALPFIECYRCSTRVYLWGAQDHAGEIIEICPGCGEHLRISKIGGVRALEKPSEKGAKKGAAPPLRERRPELKGNKEQIFFTQDKLQGLFPEQTPEEIESQERRRRLLTGTGFGLCLFVGGFMGWRLGVTPPPPPPLLVAPARPGGAMRPETLTSASPADEKAASAAVEAILAAKSVEDLLPWVLDADRVAPLMTEYYRRAAPDSHYLEGLSWKPMPQSPVDLSRGILIMAQQTGPDFPPPRPPLVLFLRREMTDKQPRCRLDWETYIQEREGTLEKFLKNPQSPPGVFRVKLQRRHVFGPEADGPAPPLGCTVQPIVNNMGTDTVIPAGHPLYPRFSRELKWMQPATATVKLRWAEPAGTGGPRLEIGEFYCWEFAGLGGQPEHPLENITLPAGDAALSPAPAAPSGPAADPSSGAPAVK